MGFTIIDYLSNLFASLVNNNSISKVVTDAHLSH